VTLRHLVHRLIYASPAGIAGVWEYLTSDKKNRMPLQTMTNKVNFNSTSHNLNITEFEGAIDLIDCNYEVAEYFAAKCNSIVFKLPDVQPGDMALLEGFMEIMTEIGEISTEFQKAISDGRISQNEMDRIAKEIGDAMSKLLAWQARVSLVVQ